MKRIISSSILILIFFSLWQSIAISLPLFLDTFLLPPLILVFSLQYFRPLETIGLSLSCGAIVDVLQGSLIGLNMLLMLIFAFIFGTTTIFSGRKSGFKLYLHVAFLSFFYRIMLIVMQIFFGISANKMYFSVFIGPFVDAALSIIFFNILARMLITAKAFDQHEYFKGRIGPSI